MSMTYHQNRNGDQRQNVRSPDNSTDLDKNFHDAKSFISSTTTKNGVNLYDHLVKCVSRLLTEQPRDPVVTFEDLSKTVRSPEEPKKEEEPKANTEEASTDEEKGLFEKPDNIEELDDDALQTPLPNILEQAYYFEQAGIGLGRDETFRIWLSLKKLLDKHQFEKLRFWGKILGTESNYYIAEAEQNNEEEGDDDDAAEETNDTEEAKDDDEEGEGEADPLPKSTYKPPPVVPKEERGAGVNKQTYYVCNYPEGSWIKLPIVKPDQIALTRQIKVLFTGDLNREIKSFPAFPGTEKNYLRAQIARISATTHVSPTGKFKFSDEEEETEEEGAKQNYQDNEDFTGAPLSELIDEELNGWVHHVLHILPQGRTSWWNPNENTGEEEENEEEEDIKPEKDEVQPEQGPPLLTPISADANIQHTKAWTAKISTKLIPQYACAYVRSNLWPGAYAFARGTIWENIYVGNGQKYAPFDYKTEFPPLPTSEFNEAQQINEADDPTPEDEAKAHAAEEHEGEGEEEHEEEAENDDEED